MARYTFRTGSKPDDSLPGKKICNAMRAIRRKIAEANEIPYWSDECDFKGPCKGTCPKCDAEIRYLNAELEKLQEQGEEIIIDGIGQEDIQEFPNYDQSSNDFDETGRLDIVMKGRPE